VRYSEYERLLFDRRDNGVLLVTMNRPEKYNATDETMHRELAQVWSDISADRHTRVAVVTGAGKAFSAGGDLSMVKQMVGDYERVGDMLSEMSSLVYNMANCEKPIISAINGTAVGAGTVVGLMADISICALDARLGDGHVKLGVAAGDHAAILWPLLCGMAKARFYLLTGEMLTGEEAERLGMVSKALPREQVLDEALRIADVLAIGSQSAIRWTKRALNNWLKIGRPDLRPVRGLRNARFHGPRRPRGSHCHRGEARAPLPVGVGPELVVRAVRGTVMYRAPPVSNGPGRPQPDHDRSEERCPVDLSYPPEVESFRDEVRAVLRSELPDEFAGLGSIVDPDDAHAWAEDWRTTLYRNRLIGVAWPEEHGGRGLTKLHQVALVEELARAGVPFGMPGTPSASRCSPTRCWRGAPTNSAPASSPRSPRVRRSGARASPSPGPGPTSPH
jgi:enoyl-CoA hydratase